MLGAWRLQAEVALRLHDLDKAARGARMVLDANPDDTAMRLLVAQTLAVSICMWRPSGKPRPPPSAPRIPPTRCC